jgi:probable rRNA maturation factor
MTMAPVVFVADEQEDVQVDSARWMRLANDVLVAQQTPDDVEVNVIFATEEVIAELNEKFMGKSGPTDVLSFPIDFPPETGGRQPDNGGNGPGGTVDSEADLPSLLGDVVLCPAKVREKAADHTGDFEDQTALLLVHGLLHLLGMDHVVEAQANVMEQRERQLLAEFYKELPASMWSTLGDDSQ